MAGFQQFVQRGVLGGLEVGRVQDFCHISSRRLTREFLPLAAAPGDINVALPIGRFQELVQAGEVGALADQQYSVMGYQPNTDEWRERTAPAGARRLRDEGVAAAFLTPV